MRVGEHPRHVRQQPGPVERLDLDLHEEQGGRRGCPLDLDDAVGLGTQGADVGAVGAVHRDPAAAGDEADDVVAGNGVQQRASLHPQVVDALHHHARVAAARPPGGALGMVASARSSLAPSSPPSDWTSFATTLCADTCPSPIAA
ncbi:hypothetical protein GCM10025868_04290 [Angustibacter aerolatus]|uniref:Uncharacterized protein n=1 Tax=Angustibacter aerolatus TaxID=1162965 RepID=A0ABQ6JCL3_9ACTN|nr:hypothetical protein GCM10025868_04290 [Angustibacter aerolatus]